MISFVKIGILLGLICIFIVLGFIFYYLITDIKEYGIMMWALACYTVVFYVIIKIFRI